MRKIYLMLGLVLVGSMAIGQNSTLVRNKKATYANGITVMSAQGTSVAIPESIASVNGGPTPCTASADTWNDLGEAPCYDETAMACEVADAGFTTIGVYGSEAYTLTDVVAGFDYVFNMCTGFGAGAWIPEVVILAPDGTTIDANNVTSGTSGQTFENQCSLGWTASQSGTYKIIINEMGTATGNAPSQASCTTSLAVDNGNPTVTCGANPAICPPEGPCVAGDVDDSVSPATLCTGESVAFATDGTEEGDGGFGFAVIPSTGAAGGNNGQAVTITGVTFPTSLDNNLGGVLSANSLPPLEGQWVFFQLSFNSDGDVCAVSADSIIVNFCALGISEKTLDLNVYPNPTTGNIRVEMTGDNSDASITVVDLTGRLIYSEKIVITSSFKKDIELNADNGQYILSIVDESAVITRRIQIIK
ncbi:MAG: hypothetical protein RL266_2195 [Bacteroidota bacterium]